MDSGWGSHRNSGGIKMFSQILGATHMSWYFNADSNHYGGACAMWFDCHLKAEYCLSISQWILLYIAVRKVAVATEKLLET